MIIDISLSKYQIKIGYVEQFRAVLGIVIATGFMSALVFVVNL